MTPAAGLRPAARPTRDELSHSPPTGRLASLDAFRGLVMAALLCGGAFASLAGHPRWGWLAHQGEHVPWAGCTAWDLIQPAFMFIVGAAMPAAAANRNEQARPWGRRFLRVLARAGKLVLLGVVLDNFGAKEWSFGFIRVLQQIAVGYVFAFLVVGRGYLVQTVAVVVILVGYHLFWTLNPWNGPGGPWARGGLNIGEAFDWVILGRNYSGHYVGLNAIPSTATMILGVMAGHLLIGPYTATRKTLILFAAGAAGVLVGLAVEDTFPLVKRIWTPSFAVYSAGWVTLGLAAFYAIIDGLGFQRWAFPLIVVGLNSTAAYVIGGLFGGWFRSLTAVWVNLSHDQLAKVGIPTGLWLPVYQRFLFALAAWGVLYWLYRRRIFFRL